MLMTGNWNLKYVYENGSSPLRRPAQSRVGGYGARAKRARRLALDQRSSALSPSSSMSSLSMIGPRSESRPGE